MEAGGVRFRVLVLSRMVVQDLIALLARKNWMVDLPPGGQHVYEEKDMDVLCEVAWTG